MDMPEVIILCGGKGTRLSEETQTKPKPMVEIGTRPILWHIMKTYANYGFNKFILALGYKGDYIKRYFYDFRITSNDFTLSMRPNKNPILHNIHNDSNWEITFVDTGIDTLKGGRIKRVEKYIKNDNFMITYGDGVADIDIKNLYDFHKKHNKKGTLTAVRPPSRFGEIEIEGDKVKHFEEKPQLGKGYINGGFFVFKKEFFDYLTPDCNFEFGPLEKLAKNEELHSYKHDGFWQCMDNVRERDYLNKLWNTNKAHWKVWK